MLIKCDCGKFQAELTQFPRATPGRCVCYCDDCQIFQHHIGRADLLDKNGGTEIIPVYPVDMKIISGEKNLKGIRLSPKGLYRWTTSCCNTPVANVKPGFPWIGLMSPVFNSVKPGILQSLLGNIKSRIQGKFAKGEPPQGTSGTLSLNDFFVVFPFVMKGFLLRKAKVSPFFNGDSATPIAPVEVLSASEFEKLKRLVSHAN